VCARAQRLAEIARALPSDASTHRNPHLSGDLQTGERAFQRVACTHRYTETVSVANMRTAPYVLVPSGTRAHCEPTSVVRGAVSSSASVVRTVAVLVPTETPPKEVGPGTRQCRRGRQRRWLLG
jgi:hypothetical protein